MPAVWVYGTYMDTTPQQIVDKREESGAYASSDDTAVRRL